MKRLIFSIVLLATTWIPTIFAALWLSRLNRPHIRLLPWINFGWVLFWTPWVVASLVSTMVLRRVAGAKSGAALIESLILCTAAFWVFFYIYANVWGT